MNKAFDYFLDSLLIHHPVNAPEEEPEETETEKKPKCEGSCWIKVKLKNRAEYLKFRKYIEPGNKWEFEIDFPAIMKMPFEFKDSLDVEMLCKKIVQLLQMGFDVYSCSWWLNESAKETTV